MFVLDVFKCLCVDWNYCNIVLIRYFSLRTFEVMVVPVCWLFGFFSSSFLWNWYCSACLVLLWDFNYFNEFFGWFFSFSKMVNVSLNQNFILWNTAIIEVLFWDYTSMSWFLGAFFCPEIINILLLDLEATYNLLRAY